MDPITSSRVVCIYCDVPDCSSISHIIPEALGRGPTLHEAVCKKCNHQINRDVEEPVIRELAPIRHFLQLLGKRKEPSSLDVQVSFGDQTRKVGVKNPIELSKKVFTFTNVTDSAGTKRKLAVFSLSKEKLREIEKTYSERHPDQIVEAISNDRVNDDLRYEMGFDLGILAHPSLLRMVAKIAFEWWCLKRTAKVLKGAEYAAIRAYVTEGKPKNYPIVSILTNERLRSELLKIPFGIHAVFLSTDVRSSDLVIVIGLFSLMYYKVIVQRSYPRLFKYQSLTTVNPQTGALVEADNTIKSPYPYDADLWRITKADCLKPILFINHWQEQILDRLNSGLQTLWETAQSKPEKAEREANVED